MMTLVVGCTTNTPAPQIPSFNLYEKEKAKDGYYKYASYWYKGKLKDGLPHGKGVCHSQYMVSENKKEWLDGACEFKYGKRVDALHQKRLEKSIAFTNLKRQSELSEQQQLAAQRERRRQEEIAERQANQQMWANVAMHGVNTLNQSLQQSQIDQANFNNRIAQTINSAQQQRERELERQRAIQQQSSVQRTPSQTASSRVTPSNNSQMQNKADITNQQSAQRRLEEEKRQAELKAKQLAEQKKREEEKHRKELELKQKEDLRKAEEARKKQEVATYKAAVKSGTRVGAIQCGNDKNYARIVGILGKATRPKHIYNDCKLTQVRYRCPSETNWKYYTKTNWLLNNACIGVGDDVRVSVNCPAEQLIVEKVGFSCDSW